METLKSLRSSAALYPITWLFIAAVVVIVFVANQSISVVVSVILLALVATFAAFVAMVRELRTVRRILNGQRAELLARLDQMADLLHAHNIPVPPEDPKVTEARNEDAAVGEVL